ncbi:hypothetical protein [Corynebacterium sp. LK2510]|uniref:hypothetical protein n=1 Tax=Corynebacterium sp. LK2510 TaxID=3110472 RepID=UPI0034CE4956
MDLGTIATQFKDLGTVLNAIAKLFSVTENGGLYDVFKTIGGLSSDDNAFEGSSELFSGSSKSDAK